MDISALGLGPDLAALDKLVPDLAAFNRLVPDLAALNRLVANFVALNKLIANFVSLHAGRHRQRTPGWRNDKQFAIGSSEIAALMNYSPYSSRAKVAAEKAGVLSWGAGSAVACWWGTFFEAVIESFVALDCGTRLQGTDISVPAPPGSGLVGTHANSPDGYCVLTLFQDAEEEWRLWTTEAGAAAAGRPTRSEIVLLEFKCPFRRRPTGAVPKHYLPQVWSGLALAPMARRGLFVDAVFRKCALWSLGPGAGYDRSYHCESTSPVWGAPLAWGLTAVYAPRLDAPRAPAGEPAPDSDGLAGFTGGGGDAAYEAWRLHYANFGLPFESPEAEARAGRAFCPDPIDFGDCDRDVFEAALGHLDAGRFLGRHTLPCFPDGRGGALQTPAEIGAAVDAMAASPPAGHFLLGVVPWKVLEVDYVFMSRRPGFLDEIRPLVEETLALADKFRGADNPAAAFQAYLCGAENSRPAGRGVATDVLQDLFDAL